MYVFFILCLLPSPPYSWRGGKNSHRHHLKPSLLDDLLQENDKPGSFLSLFSEQLTMRFLPILTAALECARTLSNFTLLILFSFFCRLCGCWEICASSVVVPSHSFLIVYETPDDHPVGSKSTETTVFFYYICIPGRKMEHVVATARLEMSAVESTKTICCERLPLQNPRRRRRRSNQVRLWCICIARRGKVCAAPVGIISCLNNRLR